MEIPDYCLVRPEGTTAADLVAFERLYTDQIEPGGGRRIDYGLAAPRWQFLCWLAETKDVLLHGSGNAGIREFEPRRPADTSEFGGRNAVFAASDGIWATFFAIVDRAVATVGEHERRRRERRNRAVAVLLLGQPRCARARCVALRDRLRTARGDLRATTGHGTRRRARPVQPVGERRTGTAACGTPGDARGLPVPGRRQRP
jgi:hypothetical protein